MNCLKPDMGTCDLVECPSHGYCHDGCGQKTNLASQNRTVHHSRLPCTWTKGMPMQYSVGHAPGSKGATHNRNVPVERLRPLVHFLRVYHGGLMNAARATGIRHSVLCHILYSSAVNATRPASAQKIVAAVLAIRNRRYPDAPHLTRVPTDYERGLVDSPEQRKNRLDKRKERERKRAS